MLIATKSYAYGIIAMLIAAVIVLNVFSIRYKNVTMTETSRANQLDWAVYSTFVLIGIVIVVTSILYVIEIKHVDVKDNGFYMSPAGRSLVQSVVSRGAF